MKRPARAVLLLALLVAGGFALRAHLAAARDQDLAELLDGGEFERHINRVRRKERHLP